MKKVPNLELSVADKVVLRIYGMGKGQVFTPKDFLDIASHETVRQAFSRLAKEGKIRRLLRGVYDYPAFSAMLETFAAPAPDLIARAIARAHGWAIVPAGETALNMLGLSTQVPAQWRYFSDGPSKRYAWDGGGTIVLNHRANKETTKLSPKTALVVHALKALGEANIDDAVMEILRQKVTARELSRALREARYATSWVFEIIKRLASEGKGSSA